MSTLDYLYAALIGFGILVAIGVVFGVVLAVCEKVFYVKEDTRIDDVQKMLPNANCGACGYPGCRGMAEALVKGEATKVSQCKVGKPDTTYKPIIEYMKEHPDEDGTTHIPTM